MFQKDFKIIDVKDIGNKIFTMEIDAPEIAEISTPGQFCNIKVSDSAFPLLRRPFSICDVEGSKVSFMFNIVGEGTKTLARKKKGDLINVLGPLGHGFNYEGEYDVAVFVAGGLGSAPFPFLTRAIGDNKEIFSFVGGRSQDDIISYRMKNVKTSTDDGSQGFKGNVVQLLNANDESLLKRKLRIFACGPNPMLSALKKYAEQRDIYCELSTECAMACGFGICQGCPIDAADREQYYLVCKDGPVFDSRKIKL